MGLDFVLILDSDFFVSGMVVGDHETTLPWSDISAILSDEPPIFSGSSFHCKLLRLLVDKHLLVVFSISWGVNTEAYHDHLPDVIELHDLWLLILVDVNWGFFNVENPKVISSFLKDRKVGDSVDSPLPN